MANEEFTPRYDIRDCYCCHLPGEFGILAGVRVTMCHRCAFVLDGLVLVTEEWAKWRRLQICINSLKYGELTHNVDDYICGLVGNEVSISSDLRKLVVRLLNSLRETNSTYLQGKRSETEKTLGNT